MQGKKFLMKRTRNNDILRVQKRKADGLKSGCLMEEISSNMELLQSIYFIIDERRLQTNVLSSTTLHTVGAGYESMARANILFKISCGKKK